MKHMNPNYDTPPFDAWLFLEIGDYFTVGRITRLSPNDTHSLSEHESFCEHDDEFTDYQFYIQCMTTKNELNLNGIYRNPDCGFFDSDFLDFYSDSIKSWSLLPSNTERQA
jgi:hypothetical protein